jgi:hypothetical protein
MVTAGMHVGAGVEAVVSSAAWGALRLVRPWLDGTGVRRREGATGQLDAGGAPAAQWAELPVVWQAEPAFDRVSAVKALHQALSAWREAERSLGATSEDGVDFTGAEAQVAVMRASYQRLFAAIRTNSREG